MIIGEHSRPNEVDLKPLKTRHLTNIRAAGKDDDVLPSPPLRLSLEQALAYICNGDLVEATPRSMRLRKRRRAAAQLPQAS